MDSSQDRSSPPLFSVGLPRIARAGRLSLIACFAVAVAVSVGCQRTPPAAPATDTAPSAARAMFDASFSIASNSGTVRFDGTVDSDSTKSRIEQALLSAYGAGRAAGTIAVDKSANPPNWAAGLPDFLKTLEPATGAAVRFEGNLVVLSGNVDLERRRSLRAAAEQAFPSARLEGLFELPEEPPVVASGKTIAPAAVAKSLNQMPLKFEDGGGNVSTDSFDLVVKAAETIKAAAPGTRLLIVGPVVATADAGNDIFLSKQRAEALKVQLILNGVNPSVIDTRGWGQNPDGTPVEGAVAPPEGAAMRFELTR